MSEKTELPTPKKLRDAREKGQVAHSKDMTQTVLILALFTYMLADSDAIVRRMGQMLVFPAGLLTMEFDLALNTIITQLLRDMVALMSPFLLIVILLGLFMEMAQTNMLFTAQALLPIGKKLDVVGNVKNLFSMKTLVEFLKSNVKIVLLSSIIYVVLRAEFQELLKLPQAGIVGVGVALAIMLKSMFAKIAVGYVVIALVDFFWQRHNHTKQLMMEKHEVQRDFKEAEGNPEIKHERKGLHQEMLNEQSVNRARESSVLVTNPTHLAIAIFYKKDLTPLPMVLAKGQGALAARMVSAAREAGVPVLQNIPLAWSLMETTPVDQYIPSELIEAVAEVLRLVQSLKPIEEQP